MGTFSLLILLIGVCVTTSQRPGCRISIRRKVINPYKLAGVWNELKFLKPPGFTGSSTLRYSWRIVPQYFGGFSITEARRTKDMPERCTFVPASWTPTNRRNIFVSDAPTGSFLRDTEYAIIDTDYKSHLVVYRCTPSFQRCGSRGVIAFVRAEQADQRLDQKINSIIVRKTCSSPVDFFFAQTPSLSCYPFANSRGR